MKTESDIRNKLKEVIEDMKAKKKDIETTVIYGQLKKECMPLRYEFLNNARQTLLELYILTWILEEPMTDELFNLAKCED